MNNQKKFRGFSRETNKMIFGFLIKDATNKEVCQIKEIDIPNNIINVIPESVGQYAEIKYDERELYTGDIVDVEYHDSFEPSAKYTLYSKFPFFVNIDKKTIRFVCGMDSNGFNLIRIDNGSNNRYSLPFGGEGVKNIKIVGNIFQNPA